MMLTVQKKIILAVVVFAVIYCCAAKPNWVWLDDDSNERKETFKGGDVEVDGYLGIKRNNNKVPCPDVRTCGKVKKYQ